MPRKLQLQSVMEFGSYKSMHDKNQSSSIGRVPAPDQRDVSATENPIPAERRPSGPAEVSATENPIPAEQRPSGSAEVNMEVPITVNEVLRAGGFGATDGIGAMLPAASDCTDFEDHLHDVRGYEGSEDAEGLSDSPNCNLEAAKADIKATGKVEGGVTPGAQDAVNMEASFFSDDVIQAGGFGATDNISSFLPVASDYTYFEETLRDARGYEESEAKTSRPSLGWSC